MQCAYVHCTFNSIGRYMQAKSYPKLSSTSIMQEILRFYFIHFHRFTELQLKVSRWSFANGIGSRHSAIRNTIEIIISIETGRARWHSSAANHRHNIIIIVELQMFLALLHSIIIATWRRLVYLYYAVCIVNTLRASDNKVLYVFNRWTYLPSELRK